MNNSRKKTSGGEHIRTLLKLQHRKAYSICRLFTNNYKEHQQLFSDIIAAAWKNIGNKKANEDKQTLLLRACLNMAALHSITERLSSDGDRSIQFKSPDYQRSMLKFRDSVGEVSDYEKMLMFMEFEKIPPAEIAELTGLVPTGRATPMALPEKDRSLKNFIPYLKEKLIWN